MSRSGRRVQGLDGRRLGDRVIGTDERGTFAPDRSREVLEL